MMYVSQIILLYTLNPSCAVCQSYLNITGRKNFKKLKNFKNWVLVELRTIWAFFWPRASPLWRPLLLYEAGPAWHLLPAVLQGLVRDIDHHVTTVTPEDPNTTEEMSRGSLKVLYLLAPGCPFHFIPCHFAETWRSINAYWMHVPTVLCSFHYPHS